MNVSELIAASDFLGNDGVHYLGTALYGDRLRVRLRLSSRLLKYHLSLTRSLSPTISPCSNTASNTPPAKT